MLPIYSSFIQQNGVKSFLQLSAPKVKSLKEIVLPRGSIYHYIDHDTDVTFPSVNDLFMRDVPSGKRVLVHHVTSLTVSEGSPLLIDKQVPLKTRRWNMENNKKFKIFPLDTEATKETMTVPVVNYNMLKHMYKYSSNIINRHYKPYNIFFTVYDMMKKMIDLNKSNKQVLELVIPSSLPSYAVMKTLSNLSDVKQSRVVTNVHMKQLLDIFTWLDSSNRAKTAFNVLNEEDSSSILLMLRYKQEVAFLPFDVIVSLLNTNELPSKAKVSSDKVQKLFMHFIRVIQSNVEVPDAAEELAKQMESDITSSNVSDVNESLDDEGENEKIEISEAESTKNQLQLKSVSDIKKIDNLVVSEDPSIFIDELTEGTGESDVVDLAFISDITSAENISDISEDLTEENKLLTSDDFKASDEDIQKLLHVENIQEKNEKDFQFMVASKTVSSSEVSSHKKLVKVRQELKSPYANDVSIDEFKVINDSDLVIKAEDRVMTIDNELVDESIKMSSLRNMDKNYIKNVLPKDVVASVLHMEKAGITIKEYTIESSSTAMGNYETHHLILKPLKGPESSIYFRLPKVNSEGDFIAAGVKYKMKRQRADLPIRKVAFNIVKLSSAYGKLFVSATERKAYDTLSYVSDHIKDVYFSDTGKDNKLQKVSLGNVFKNTYQLPVIIQSLSKSFSSITISNLTFLFDQTVLHEYVDEKIIKDLKEHGFYFCGYNVQKKPIVCDMSDMFYIYTNQEHVDKLGHIEDLLQIDTKKIPVSFSDIKILGKALPLGVMLAYYLGFKNLIKILKPSLKIIESNKRYELQPNEWQLRFSDYKLIFDRHEKENSLVLAGFTFFKDFIKLYNLEDFDTKNIYMNLVEERDFGIWHLKELDIINDLFLDPITIEQLKLMGEPTGFVPLLLRANSMLVNFSHPDINDTRFVRIKGYERVATIVYKTLSESIRDYKFKNTVKNKIELNPYEVWNAVTQDTSVKIVEDINPVMNLKEMEAVTLGGSDGIAKDMVASKLREYNSNDMGLFSEASGDGSDVAINTFLSVDPKFSNIRGNVDLNNNEYKKDSKKLLSTSSMLAVGTNLDD